MSSNRRKPMKLHLHQPKFQTPFNNRRVRFSTSGPSMTHQSMKAECDINNIMRKYERDGIISHRNTYEGQYGDFTDLPQDYQSSLNAVIDAQEMFLTLPARVRAKFENDPASFLEFVSDPRNQDEMIDLGLASRSPSVLEDEPPKPAAKPAAKPAEKPAEKPAG
ncbi:internal scaffolding protein [Microviridae sp.]|nr:internal scaffolding protein [Microviridae sp.]